MKLIHPYVTVGENIMLNISITLFYLYSLIQIVVNLLYDSARTSRSADTSRPQRANRLVGYYTNPTHL